MTSRTTSFALVAIAATSYDVPELENRRCPDLPRGGLFPTLVSACCHGMGAILGSLASVEADLAVGQSGGLVGGVVDAAVVVGAEESAGADVGGSALGPGDVVVGVAEAGWGFAVFLGAAAVSDAHDDAHGFGVAAAFAAGVEDLALAAQDEGDDAGGAGQAAGLGGGDAAAGVQGADPGGVEVGQQLLQGHGHHDRG